jgi:hypothetical protein
VVVFAEWDEVVEIKGLQADGKLTLRVKDYDTFGSDDDIGELVVSMKDILAQISSEGSKPCWKKLSGVGAGDGELCVGFEVEGGAPAAKQATGTVASAVGNRRKLGKQTKQEKQPSCSVDLAPTDFACLVVHILRAKDLTPFPDIGSLDPSVIVSVGDREYQTVALQACTDPGQFPFLTVFE